MWRGITPSFDDLKISPEARVSRYDPLAITALAVLVVGIFSGNLLTRTYPVDPFWIEIAHTHMPVKIFFRKVVDSGHFPIWIPHLQLGYPSISNPHGLSLYLPTVFFYFLNFLPGMTAFIIFHLLVMAVTLYGFTRALGIRPPGAFAGAMSMVFGGYIFTNLGYVPIASTFTWIPLLLWITAKILLEVRLKLLICLAVVTVLQFTGGDLEMIVYEWIFILIAIATIKVATGDEWLKGRSWFIALAISAAIAVILIAIQFLPLVELFSQSERKGGFATVPFEGGIGNVVKVFGQAFSIFFLPVPLAGHYINVSLMATGFGILGWLKSDRRLKWIIGILFFFCLINGIKNVSPLQHLFSVLPLFKVFRFPIRLLFFAQLIMCVSAAWGIDYFVESWKSDRKFPFWLPFGLVFYGIVYLFFGPSRSLAIALMILAAIGAAGVFVKLFPRKEWVFGFIVAILIADPFLTSMKTLPHLPPNGMDPYPEVAKLFEDNQSGPTAFSRSIMIAHEPDARFQSGQEVGWGGYTPGANYSVYLMRYALFFSLMAPEAFEFDKGYDKVLRHYEYYFLFHFYEKGNLGAESLPWLNLSGTRYLLLRGHNMPICSPFSVVYEFQKGKIEGASAENRIGKENVSTPDGLKLALSAPAGATIKFQAPISAGSALKTGLATDTQLDSIPLKMKVFLETQPDVGQIDVLSMELPPANTDFRIETNSPPISYSGMAWLCFKSDIKNPLPGRVKWVAPEIINPSAPFQRIVHGNVDIYENNQAYPRVFYAYEPKVFANTWDVFKFMRTNPNIDFQRDIFLETRRDDVEKFSPPAQKDENPRIISYLPDIVKITANPSAPAYMIFTDIYYPGWRAFIDGVEVPILPADGAFRAVKISPGQHRVDYIFLPDSFRIGLWITLTTMLCALLFFFKADAIGRKMKLSDIP